MTRCAGRLTPAANVDVAARTPITLSSKADSKHCRSSTVNPAHARPHLSDGCLPLHVSSSHFAIASASSSSACAYFRACARDFSNLRGGMPLRVGLFWRGSGRVLSASVRGAGERLLFEIRGEEHRAVFACALRGAEDEDGGFELEPTQGMSVIEPAQACGMRCQ
eukprot:3917493-Rhodomonas_salina.1